MSAYALLLERMRPVCRDAVDDAEVAAVLESDGVTDAVAQRRYGSPDVFHLAARLRGEVPRQPSARPPVDGPWRSSVAAPLLRGVLFGLPTLCFLAVSGLGTGRAAVLLSVGSVLLSWAAGQSLAYLGFARLGRGDPAAAARVLRGGLVVGSITVLTVTGLSALPLGVPPAVVGGAAVQVVYLLAATVALVLKAELLLLAALAPGVLGAVAGLVIGGGALRSAPVALCTVVSVLACVALAWWATRGARPALPEPREAAASMPHALFGFSVGGLLLFVPAAAVLAPAGTVTLTTGGALAGLAALVPLSLSMGLAEWLLVRYRITTHRALQRATTLDAFGKLAGAALLRTVSGYLVALAAGCGAAAAVVAERTQTVPSTVALAGYVALGGALFTALTLMSFGVRVVPVATCGTALAAEIALLTWHHDPVGIQLGVALASSAGLLRYALSALGHAARHI